MDLYRQTAERLLRGVGIGRGMQVLDIGCGTGETSLVAAKLTGPNGLVLGLDSDRAAVRQARARARREELDHAYFLEAAVNDLRDEAIFDAVIGHLIRDAGDSVTAVRDAARLLRPGGVIAFPESSPALLQVLADAGLAAPQLFGATESGQPQFCISGRKPE